MSGKLVLRFRLRGNRTRYNAIGLKSDQKPDQSEVA